VQCGSYLDISEKLRMMAVTVEKAIKRRSFLGRG